MRNQTLISVLEAADAAASMERCGVDDVHKEAMRSYIETWVRSPIQDAIANLKGELRAEQIAHWSRS